ncbi:MAG: 8-amino-7-oxononanoate synthase [Rhodocyclaceae bacterium]|nr:8-amino-7-oxononanoate synthase [Rhodocyclaceae bacterium]
MTPSDIDRELAQLDAAFLKRVRRTPDNACGPEVVLQGRPLVAFASNDYLGLANDPALKQGAIAAIEQWGVGAGASQLVSGRLAIFETLEQRLAEFAQREAALFFPSGFQANLGVLTALADRHDVIFADKVNHASLIDGALLSRAQHVRYQHIDLDDLANKLKNTPVGSGGTRLIVTDSVFSMDGDEAPLPALMALAEQYDAWLIVDDAHGLGVIGPQGRGSIADAGLPPHPQLIMIGTLGKAAGVSGAFVAAGANVIEWLIQRARSYIYTTGASPMIAGALLAALEQILQGDERRAQLQRRIAELRAGITTLNLPFELVPSRTGIQALVIGDNVKTLAVAAKLLEQGYWVPAIRPPTVPVGSARLRISLSAAHTPGHITGLVDALAKAV